MNFNINTIEISENAAKNYTKSYASRQALDKGTKELETLISKHGSARKLIVAIPDGIKAGRLTAIFILDDKTRFLSIHVAHAGFQVIA